jgi:hypothetical protein
MGNLIDKRRIYTMKTNSLHEMLDNMSWEQIEKAMDPEILDEIHRDYVPSTFGEFYAVYSQLHLRKYGKQFEV